ncbi:hypothetical protein [uncultured Jannaschia sp.]|uniref:hypothetical protein n=1 Tax=uncultured Jannaschia sp. TaxID=293347 RepID=UPI002630068D|nr:hypothetical protein [uncultured Jannaschia sp.]
MIRRALPLALALLAAAPAGAGLTPAELDAVGARPGAAAFVPADLGLTDGTRPAVLVFADYDCPEICDPLVAQIAASLAGTGLDAGADYRLVVVGIDPRDDAAARDAFLGGTLGAAREAAVAPLLSSEDLTRLTRALGFSYAFDAERERFAHPVASYVLTPAGRVSRLFPGLFTDPADMRRALVQAGRGTVGGLAERLALTCYGFDPLTGRYSLAIERVLTIVSLLFAAAFGGALALAHWRERRRGGA